MIVFNWAFDKNSAWKLVHIISFLLYISMLFLGFLCLLFTSYRNAFVIDILLSCQTDQSRAKIFSKKRLVSSFFENVFESNQCATLKCCLAIYIRKTSSCKNHFCTAFKTTIATKLPNAPAHISFYVVLTVHNFILLTVFMCNL